MVVYAAVPLPSELLSVGRWGALACYAATPWIVHLLRHAAGIESSGVQGAAPDEHVIDVDTRKRVRLVAQIALLVAVTIAFVPSFVIVVVGVGVLLAAHDAARRRLVASGGRDARRARSSRSSSPGCSTCRGRPRWSARAPGPQSSGCRRSARTPSGSSASARFGVGRGDIGVLALALYLPVLAAPLVARGWRFTWAIRAAGLVVGFGFLIVLDDRGSLPVRMPEPGVLLAPVAVGRRPRRGVARRGVPGRRPQRVVRLAPAPRPAQRAGDRRRGDPGHRRDRQRSLRHAAPHVVQRARAAARAGGRRRRPDPVDRRSARRAGRSVGLCQGDRLRDHRCPRPAPGGRLGGHPVRHRAGGHRGDRRDPLGDHVARRAAAGPVRHPLRRSCRSSTARRARWAIRLPVPAGLLDALERSARPGHAAAHQPGRLRALREHRMDAGAQRAHRRRAPPRARAAGPRR